MNAQPAPPHPAGGLAAVIRRARLAARLTQREVASGVGVEQSMVSQWERGRTIPTVPLFAGLVALLGPWPLLEALLPSDQAGIERLARLSGAGRQGPSGGVGASIRTARQAAGLTQAQLAVRVGVGQSAVGQWEGGRTIPTLPMLHSLVGVLGPWPLLETLIPPQPAGTEASAAAAALLPRSRPSRQELARLVLQEGRSDTELAAHYAAPIGTILRWRRADRLDRAAPPPQPMGRPARLVRPSHEELGRLAIGQGHTDQELAQRYGCSPATIKRWRARYGLVRERGRVDRARALTLLRQGLRVDQIAEAVGCTPRRVYQLAQAAGVQVASGARPRARRRDLADPEAVRQWASHHKQPSACLQGRRHPATVAGELTQSHNIPLPTRLHPTTPTRQEPV